MKTPVGFEIARLLTYTNFNQRSVDVGYTVSTKELSFDYPLEYTNRKAIAAPNIAEVVMWLEDKHYIWISVLCDCGNENLFTFKIYSTEPGEESCLFNGENYNLPTEAYLAAIEYTLKQIIL